MTDRSPRVTDAIASGHEETGPTARVARRVRRLAWLGAGAQVVFVLSWLLAAAWQGPRYSVTADSISDMYAVTAPGGGFLVVMLTLTGAATIWFAWRSLWPVLRPAGWLATTGAVLLGLSIFGLGDLLTVSERVACRIADPGCTAAMQTSNSGGALDSVLSTAGVPLFVLASFFLAAAMKRVPGWRFLVSPVRWCGILTVVFYGCDSLTQGTNGFSGLFERLVALSGAAGIALLAVGVTRHSMVPAVPPERCRSGAWRTDGHHSADT